MQPTPQSRHGTSLSPQESSLLACATTPIRPAAPQAVNHLLSVGTEQSCLLENVTYMKLHSTHSCIRASSAQSNIFRSVHITAFLVVCPFLLLSNIPFDGHITYNLFIHSAVDGHLGSFQVLTITNKASVNTCV